MPFNKLQIRILLSRKMGNTMWYVHRAILLSTSKGIALLAQPKILTFLWKINPALLAISIIKC